jgi:diguanylate cyclase (GGDEF)-like protein
VKPPPSKKRRALSHRIAVIMILTSFLLVVAFAIIQVRNQINTITNYNAYRARLAAAIVKSHLETSLEQSEDPQEAVPALEQTLFSLKDERIIDRSWIIDSAKKVVASTDPGTTRADFTLSDRYMVETIWKKEFIDQWFYSYVDKEHSMLDLYIPLVKGDKLEYLAKTSFSLGNMQEALKQVYVPLAFTVLAVVLINIVLGLILSKSIVNPIQILNQATKEISGGKLQLRVDIRTGDEIQELGETFNNMAQALIKMKARAESSNPLTKLPGNVAIREDLENRLQQGRKFVFVHSDLDNFKAYNDKYGLANGDRAIIATAELFKESVAKVGNPDDFLGHEGGDDFVVITTPERAETLTSYFIKRFGEEIPKLYSEEDRKIGYIVAKNRQGVVCKFPLMSISLAGVTNQHRPLSSYTEITNIMPELKEKAKSIQGSCFVMDQRQD